LAVRALLHVCDTSAIPSARRILYDVAGSDKYAPAPYTFLPVPTARKILSDIASSDRYAFGPYAFRLLPTARRALSDVSRSDKHASGLFAFRLRIWLWIRHVYACVEHAFNYIRYALLAMMTWIHGKMCLADIGDEHSETSSLVTTTPSSSSLTCGASGRACSGTSTTIIQTSIGYGLSSSSQSSATRQEASITASCKPSGLLHVG